MSLDCNEEWESFCSNNADYLLENIERRNEESSNVKCGEIYISTKTIISYLSQPLDIHDVFWRIPIINYEPYLWCN